jgi:hypothetical protein
MEFDNSSDFTRVKKQENQRKKEDQRTKEQDQWVN